MEIDKTTLQDLMVIQHEDEFSIFGKLNETLTVRGKEQFLKNLMHPFSDAAAIIEVQQVLILILKNQAGWTNRISNGTLMVVERFYEAQINTIPSHPGKISAYSYKIFSSQDFSLVRYSISHCLDFIRGMQSLYALLWHDDIPLVLKKILSEVSHLVSAEPIKNIEKYNKTSEMPMGILLQFAHFIRYRYKHNMHSLLQLFAHIDAWYGMAKSVQSYQLVFPEIIDSSGPLIEADGLYHLLLPDPVPYSIKINKENNFIFLTGANMAGKSTFIKAVGAAVFLAHCGMGIPAQSMRLSSFDGLLSNINIVDNLAKGESYFYNEVQRIKATVNKVKDGRKWLILIDELFKGTNVQDAMKCSTSVIEGLIRIKNSAFILSTHLYEIGNDLRQYNNISFQYFETEIKDDQLAFSYSLKEGISSDRLGYYILKKEGVVRLLENL